MKHFILIFTALVFVSSSIGFAASKKKFQSPTQIQKVSSKKKVKTESQWSKVCQELLDTSVDSTLKLEKSVTQKRKISKSEFDEKIHNELLVVQLNAWVCALSVKDQMGVAAEQLFLQDYSKLVQTKKL